MNTIILFDMDGTLIDSTDAIYKSFSKVFIDNNMPELSKKEVSKFIGYTLNDMFKFFGAKEECIPRYCDEYKSHYIKICNQYTHLITNVRDSIILASSFAHLGIVTTKSSRSSKELLANFGIDKYFKTIIGREDVNHTKPHKEPILKALDSLNLNIDKNKTYMIGDTILDLNAAKNAGVVGIGVLSGYGTLKDLNNISPYTFKDTLEAVSFIKTLHQ